MYAFCVHIDSFGSFTRAEATSIIAASVEMLAMADIAYLRIRPDTPPLYSSGVLYCRDERGRERQWWDIPRVLAERCADCKALAAWRIAELRMAGHTARALVTTRDGTLFHVRVETSHGVEDPSEILGM